MNVLALKPHVESAEAAATTPHDRGQIAGYQLRNVLPVVAWPIAGLGLLTGANLIRAILIIAFAWSVRAGFRDYTLGVATGRKAAQLAAAPEYVAGRAQPGRIDYAIAVLYFGVTCLLPIIFVLRHLALVNCELVSIAGAGDRGVLRSTRSPKRELTVAPDEREC